MELLNAFKSMIISTLDRYIHYASEYYVRKTHDFSLIKSEFNPDLDWFKKYQIRLDLDFKDLKKIIQTLLYLSPIKTQRRSINRETKNVKQETSKSKNYS